MADANGDGRLDIVNNSGVLLGNGVGDFGAASNVTQGLYQFAVADFNHDARPDLVASRVSSEGGFVDVALNTSSFTPAGSFAAPLDTPTLFNVDWLALAPMSRDANLDVITARSGNPMTGAPGTIVVHLGTGSGTFGPSGGSEQLNKAHVNVDFNRDSKPDVVAEFTNGNIASWLGDGNGGFVAGYGLNPGARYDAFAVGDFNRDGRNDLAAIRTDGRVLSIWLQESTGTSFAMRRDTFMSDWPYDLRVGDVNADGRLDVVALVNEVGAQTFLGDGQGNFASGIPSPIAQTGSGLALGDMNNDGKLDIVSTDTYSFGPGPHIRVSLGDGAGSFEEVFALRATDPSAPVLVDFNRDGQLDVVIHDGGVAVYFGRGDGSLDARSTHLAGVGKFEAGDINNDGRIDIVALAGDRFSVFLNTAPPVADLSISVTDSPDPVAAGGRITYEMRVTNNGTTTVSGVTVRPGFALGTNIFSADNTCTGGLPYACHVGTLAAGATATLTFVVTAGSSGIVSIVATVTANAADANSANNTVTVSTTVTATAVVTIDRNALRFAATSNGAAFTSQTPAETVRLSVAGTASVSWTATSNQPWLTVSPASGIGPATLTVAVAFVNGLPIGGEVTGSVTLAFSGASNTAGPITVTLRTIAGASTAPFGVVDTPLDNTTGVTGAVPFTGWALDDVGVQSVSLCRDAVAGETPVVDQRCGQVAKIYLGNGVFIEGARPDVEAAYPAVPRNRVAGWGFMVLTNMLPNQGNGAFDFFVYARDLDGQATLIGTRRLTVSNATATRPFGTIDTPAQGETVSGSQYVNFGWALTQMPKSIPTSGSTISVLIDGAVVGSVWYDHFRPDVASLFPGLANSDGAVGFRIIDTTALTNGVHSISWTATDSDGRSGGLGSRYFRVLNNAGAGITMSATANMPVLDVATVWALPVDTDPIDMRRGWSPDAAWAQQGANRAGRAIVRGEEVDRFELRLGARAGETYTGFVRAGESLQPLPAGSRLNEQTGDFVWAPGAGFVGPYNLVFVRAASGRAIARREVQIILSPKGSGHVGAKVVIDTPRLQEDVAQPFLLAGWAADSTRFQAPASTACTSGRIRSPAARQRSSGPRRTAVAARTSPRCSAIRMARPALGRWLRDSLPATTTWPSSRGAQFAAVSRPPERFGSRSARRRDRRMTRVLRYERRTLVSRTAASSARMSPCTVCRSAPSCWAMSRYEAPLFLSSSARTRRSAIVSTWPRRPRWGRCCASVALPLCLRRSGRRGTDVWRMRRRGMVTSHVKSGCAWVASRCIVPPRSAIGTAEILRKTNYFERRVRLLICGFSVRFRGGSPLSSRIS